MKDMRRHLVLAVAVGVLMMSCRAGAAPLASESTGAAPLASESAGASAIASPSLATSGQTTPRPVLKGRIEKGTFRSSVLNRTMPFTVYLPPGYEANPSARYPAVYLLHGGGGDINEWPSYGLIEAADRLMGTGAIPPYLIVLPFGAQEYWVDHVTSRIDNGEKWGTYAAKEVVPEMDRRYQTQASQAARAIGGLSMGGHGAMQLPMNFPGVWSAIGAHSPAIRPEGDAATFLGRGAEYAARDPLSLITTKPDLARIYTWWIDSGDADPWIVPATAVHDRLSALGISNAWHPYKGDHAMDYWQAHLEDYLRYYAGALCARSTCPRLP